MATPFRLNLGQGIENIGTFFGLPEWGRSESVAGRNTALTGKTPQSYQAMYPAYPASSQNQYSTTGVNPAINSGFGDLLKTNPSGGGNTNTQQTDSSSSLNTPSGPNIDLDSLYSGLFDSLSNQYNDLNQRRASREQIVQNTIQQGYNTLSNQYSQNKGEIENQQTKTLNDLTDALRQQWQTGNAMLGTRGASDSSAANQYAYALTKLGTRQRGEVMQEISGRLNNLKQTYDTNMNNLRLEMSSKMEEIADWFSDAQGQIRTMEAGLQKEKSEQALTIALQMFDRVQQEAVNQKSILDQWAANNATSLTQLQSQLQQNAQNLPTFQGIDGSMSGGGTQASNLFGYGTNEEQQKSLV